MCVRLKNCFVVDRLVEAVNATLPAPRSYAVVQADTDDARGIDVAFISDNTLFQVPLPFEGSVFWPIAGAPDGSFYFDNHPNMLDQFLANKNKASGNTPIKVDSATVQIFRLRQWSIEVSTRSRSRSAEWASRSSERVLRPFPNHDQSHRGRLGRRGEGGPGRPSV